MPVRNDSIYQPIVPSDFSIQIGTVDVTRLVSGFELSRPLPDLDLPLLWEGTLTLGQPINLTEGRRMGKFIASTDPLYSYSLDPVQNNDLKAYGQPVRIQAEGHIIILRFIEDLNYDFNAGTATGRLGHRINALNRQKAKPVTGFSGGAINGQLPAFEYAKKIFYQALDANGDPPGFDINIDGLPSILLNGDINGFDTDQNVTGNLADQLHRILIENYQRSLTGTPGSEDLRVTEEYPLSEGDRAPIIRLPYTQTKITVESFNPEPATTITEATGSILRGFRASRDAWPKTWVSANFADGSTAEETEMDEPNIVNGESTTIEFTRRAQGAYIAPGGTGVVIFTDTHTTLYLGDGRPTEETLRIGITRHQLGLLTGFRDAGAIQEWRTETDNGNLATIDIELIREWTYDEADDIKTLTEDVRLPRQYILEADGDGLITAFRRLTVYEPLEKSLTPEWQKTISEVIPRGAIEGSADQTLVARPGSNPTSKPVSGVPKPPYQKRKEPKVFERLASTSELQSLGLTEIDPRRQDVQLRYATSQESAAKVAELSNVWVQQQRPQLWDVQMAVPTHDMLNGYPVAHIDNGHAAYSVVVCGQYLQYETDGLSQHNLIFGWSAYRLGELSDRIRPLIPPVEDPVWLPPLPGQTTPQPIPLSVAPVTTLTLSQAARVISPIELTAYGGTPPYTWSATGLPAGLSISGNQIVGTATTPTPETQITVTAQDAVGATASTQFYMQVIAIGPPVPIYSFPAIGAIAMVGEITGATAIPNILEGVVEAEGEIVGEVLEAAARGVIESEGEIVGEAVEIAARGVIEAEGEIVGESVPPIVEGVIESEGEISGETRETAAGISPIAYYSLDETTGDFIGSIAGNPVLTRVGTIGSSSTDAIGNKITFTGNASNHIISTDDFFDFNVNGGQVTRAIFFTAEITSRIRDIGLVTKYDFLNPQRNWAISFNGPSAGSDRITFVVSPDGVAFDNLIDTTSIPGFTFSLNTKYFILVYYDSARAKLGLSIDGSVPVEVDYTGGFFEASTADFMIGRYDVDSTNANFTQPHTGSLDELGILDFVPNQDQINYLAAGRSFAELADYTPPAIDLSALANLPPSQQSAVEAAARVADSVNPQRVIDELAKTEWFDFLPVSDNLLTPLSATAAIGETIASFRSTTSSTTVTAGSGGGTKTENGIQASTGTYRGPANVGPNMSKLVVARNADTTDLEYYLFTDVSNFTNIYAASGSTSIASNPDGTGTAAGKISYFDENAGGWHYSTTVSPSLLSIFGWQVTGTAVEFRINGSPTNTATTVQTPAGTDNNAGWLNRRSGSGNNINAEVLGVFYSGSEAIDISMLERFVNAYYSVGVI